MTTYLFMHRPANSDADYVPIVGNKAHYTSFQGDLNLSPAQQQIIAINKLQSVANAVGVDDGDLAVFISEGSTITVLHEDIAK